jgi:hypothetical protein
MPRIIKKNTVATTTTGETVSLTIGAKASRTLPATTTGNEYQNTIVITATANQYNPSAPTITAVSPNSGSTSGGEGIVITGTNLDTAYQVFIDLDRDGEQGGGEECINADIVSITSITCNTPTATSAGTYDVVVKTWGGATKTAAGTTSRTNDNYTYETTTPSGWVKADSATTNTDAVASNYQIDIDANMISVIRKDDYDQNTVASRKWADYADKRWANAVTLRANKLSQYKTAAIGTEIPEEYILGYWTYVPRYAYEVQRYYAFNKPQTAQNFDVHFEKAIDAKKIPTDVTAAIDPNCYTAPLSSVGSVSTGGKDYRTECNANRTYGAETGTTWATHPAFTFGTIELNGIWVGKFKTTGSVLAPTIKPNLNFQVSQTLNVKYDIAKSVGVLDTNAAGGGNTSITQNSHSLATAKTHQQKNSEWGAAAYLSASIYGAGVNNVQNNSDDYQTETGQRASTTNNVYGIYGMAGGTSEYVMANLTDSIAQTTTGLSIPITNGAYYDSFISSAGGGLFGIRQAWSAGSIMYFYNFDVCTFVTCGGQASYETTIYQSVYSSPQSWGGGGSYFMYLDARWINRTGMFASEFSNGSANNWTGFRISLIAF